ncbi:MAG: hypothetical protein ABH950_08820 [Candidatus Altiarchaeota archaeon]
MKKFFCALSAACAFILLSTYATSVIPECEPMEENQRNLCYLENATRASDCGLIKTYGLAQQCLQKIAQETLYTGRCLELPDELQEMCLGRVEYKKRIGSLHACETSKYKKECYIYGALYEGEGNSSRCEKIPEIHQNNCYKAFMDSMVGIEENVCNDFPKIYEIQCIKKVEENWQKISHGLPLPKAFYRLYQLFLNTFSLIFQAKNTAPIIAVLVLILGASIVLIKRLGKK